MRVAAKCYRVTRKFPKDEIFALTSQIRRAASRIPANIAEGFGRNNRSEYRHFVGIANGSLKELETHLLLSVMIEIAEKAEADAILDECDEQGRMLAALIRSLEKPDSK